MLLPHLQRKTFYKIFWDLHKKKMKKNLMSLNGIRKLHKSPYEERYIAGSSIFSTLYFSTKLTSFLFTVIGAFQKYWLR